MDCFARQYCSHAKVILSQVLLRHIVDVLFTKLIVWQF